MALSEQTAARLVGFDELGVQVQISTLQVIEADLRRALSADVPAEMQGSAERVSRGGATREVATDRFGVGAPRSGEVALGSSADDRGWSGQT